MGNCRFCGESAGFLRNQHKECFLKNQDSIQTQKIYEEACVLSLVDFVLSGKDFAQCEQICFLNDKGLECSRKDIAIKAWSKIIQHYMDDDLIDKDEEIRIVEFMKHFDINGKMVEVQNDCIKLAKMGILRDIATNVINPSVTFTNLPNINFQKNEKIMWLFCNTEYHEEKTARSFVGRSNGVSIRLAKGLYFRTSAFSGHPVESKEQVHIGTGDLIITDKNIYFSCSAKALRIPYQKILSTENYNNGIGILQDNKTAKPQLFITEDGWFLNNLVVNLMRIE